MTPIGCQVEVLPANSSRACGNAIGLSRTAKSRVALARQMSNRPPAIRNAISRAPHLAATVGLSESVCKVLIAMIATCMDANRPAQVMFAKKNTLAKVAGCSESTFYRNYRLLRAANLISVNEQQRYGDGSMGISTFSFTVEAICALGFDVPAGGSLEPKDSNVPETQSASERDGVPAELTVGSTNVDQSTYPTPDRKAVQSFRKQSAGAAPRTSTPRAYIRVEGRIIPAEFLELIRDHGFSATGVLSLMKTAKSSGGHRLSTIYAAVKPTLDARSITGKQRYAYLSACAQDANRDWGEMVRRLTIANESLRRTQNAQRAAERLVGSRYVGAESGALWSVERGVDGQVRLESHLGCVMLGVDSMQRVLDDIKAGKLLPVSEAEEYCDDRSSAVIH